LRQPRFPSPKDKKPEKAGFIRVGKTAKVVEGPHKSLSLSAEAGIRPWKYRPALCNGQPVSEEEEISTDYSLSIR
jgi:hypothetical protein